MIRYLIFLLLLTISGTANAQFTFPVGNFNGEVVFFLDRYAVDSAKGINDTQDFTSPEIDFSVKGLFTLTSPFTTSGAHDGASMGVGAADFSDDDGSFVVVTASQDGVGSSATLADSTKTGALGSFKADASAEEYIGQTEGTGIGSNPGHIPSGFRTQYKVFDPVVDALFDAVSIGGNNIQWNVQTIVGAGSSQSKTTTFGFEADFILFISTGDVAPQHMRLCIGYATENPTLEQGYIAISDRNSSTTKISFSKTGDSFVANLINVLSGGDLLSLTVDDITSTGVDYTFNGNWSGNRIRVIGVKVANGNAWAGLVDAPTTAGSDWVVTAPGFEPGFIGIVQGAGVTLNTAVDGAAFGVSLIVGTKSVYTSISTQDAVSTSNTATEIGAIDASMLFKAHDKTTLYDIDTITPTATGWIATAANITTASGTARKMLAWAIEGDVAE